MTEQKSELPRTLVVVLGSLLLGGGVAALGADGGLSWRGAPALALCFALSMGIQWLAWIPASLARSDRYYDFTGSMTFVTLVSLTLGWRWSQGELHPRQLLFSALVLIWALRLGTFLLRRILQTGHDRRMDLLKARPVTFLVPWTLQGLWVFMSALVVLIFNTRAGPAAPLGVWDALGLGLWTLGFVLEVVADRQKDAFRKRERSPQPWIDEGLWSRARHPNYGGEILLWSGIALAGVGSLSGGQWVGLLSPVFVAVLLTQVSGVPMLDQRARERWGALESYQAYRRRTALLFPWPWRGRRG